MNRGVAYSSVELVPFKRAQDSKFRGPWEIAKEDGSFKFEHVAPGDYLLVFDRKGRIDPDKPYGTTYFPAATDVASASTVHLALGQQFKNADIHVAGGVPVRELIVRVQWANGVAAKDALVFGRATTVNGEMSQQEIAHGAWRVKLLQGVRYDIGGQMICQAWGDGWVGPGKRFTTDVVTIPADSNPPELKLVLNGDLCPPGYVKGPPPQH